MTNLEPSKELEVTTINKGLHWSAVKIHECHGGDPYDLDKCPKIGCIKLRTTKESFDRIVNKYVFKKS